MPTERILALKELALKDYQAYLQTEHWLTIRHAALGRARFCCALCNSRKDLQVHHRSYEHLGEEWDCDTLVLCAECHQKHHFGEKEFIEWVADEWEAVTWLSPFASKSQEIVERDGLLSELDFLLMVWVITGVRIWRKLLIRKNLNTGVETLQKIDLIPALEILALNEPWISKLEHGPWLICHLEDEALKAAAWYLYWQNGGIGRLEESGDDEPEYF